MALCSRCGSVKSAKRNRCYVCSPAKTKSGKTIMCVHCSAPFYVQRYQLNVVGNRKPKYCSNVCKNVALTGVEIVKGTRCVRKDGYVQVKVGIREYQLEHRIVMEGILGRKLDTDEHVHHLNSDRADNRPENLEVLTSSEHAKLHDHPQMRSRRVTLHCKRCGSAYERRQSRVAESNYCSNVCKLIAMHEGNRKDKIYANA